MAQVYVPLPAYQWPQNATLDFSQINGAIDALGKQFEKNRLLDQNKRIGAAAGPSGDTQTAVANPQPATNRMLQTAPATDVDPYATKLLKDFEGFSAKPYGDYKQTSIGYGTRAQPGETSLSEADATARLQAEAGKVAGFVDAN